MKAEERTQIGESRNIRPWVYITALAANIAVFLLIGAVFVSSSRSYNRTLFEENIRTVESLNAASANAADTYIQGMKGKVDDIVNYIYANRMDYGEVVTYLSAANTDPARQLQLVLCGSYGASGQLSFGDYSGLSFRRVAGEDGGYATQTAKIRYGSGYYEIYASFTDTDDLGVNELCFTQEFTDPDTKQKCFAAYRHVELLDGTGRRKLYAILLAVNSQEALSSYNMQSEFQGQSAVLVTGDGDYIIKNSDYRNANFYEYIVNYNGLTLDWKARLQEQVRLEAVEGDSANLYYKNHQGADCVFTVNAMKSNWYSITCVPLSTFRLESTTVNYTLIVLILFLLLFLADSVVIWYVGKTMRFNVNVAERATRVAVSANKAKSRFLSTMSHELRTPLNAIIGLVALSGDSLEEPAVLRNYLRKIDISSKLLLQLISDILDVSAIESDKLKLNPAEFDISKLITALSAIYYDQCAAKGVEFEVSLRNMSSTALVGDAVRVNQVLLNFLSNAVKFTPDGGRVVLRAEQLRREDATALVRFEVSDTGCGISQELRGRLFRPFERENGDAGRKYGGSGLGLSIAKNLVELMHGTLGMESTENVGTCFWAEIPFGIPESEKRRGFGAIGRMRVLAAVSSEDERDYIGQLLKGFGLEYELAGGGAQALELLSAGITDGKPVDLCMLDWKMADWSALEAVKRIRAKLGDKSPRIMVLAYDIADAGSRAVEAGADLVFGKPVFPSALYNALGEIARNHVEPVAAEPVRADLSGKRVLLVEDNLLNTEIAVMLLSKLGLEVETAENGKLGLDRFTASPSGWFDAILMDVQMPVMNGYEAAAAIRRCGHPQAKSVPILAMTADAFAEDVERARAAGMNEHISKPVVPENLYALLKAYLR